MSSPAALRPDRAEVIAAAVAPSAVPMAAAVADEMPATPALSRMANKPPLAAVASHDAASDPAAIPVIKELNKRVVNKNVCCNLLAVYGSVYWAASSENQ